MIPLREPRVTIFGSMVRATRKLLILRDNSCRRRDPRFDVAPLFDGFAASAANIERRQSVARSESRAPLGARVD